jgi:hypothetical protein
MDFLVGTLVSWCVLMLHAVEREDADRQNQDPRGVQTSADKRLAAESTRGISWKRSWRVQELSLLIKDSRHKLTGRASVHPPSPQNLKKVRIVFFP